MPTPEEALDLAANDDFAGGLDSGLEFIRASAAWTVPMYVLAAAPTALVMLPIMGEIARHRPSAAMWYCQLLLPAMVWRWCVLAVIQQRVRGAITGKTEPHLLKRVFPLVIVRLALAAWVVWGCYLLVVPAFPALILGGLVAPILLDAPRLSLQQLSRPLLKALVSPGVWRHLLAILLTLGAVYVGLIATMQVMARTVIPSLAGISDLRLQLLLGSSVYTMGIGLFIWMAFDLLWHVSAPILFYQLQSRRTGADIQFRLQSLRETAR